MSVHLRRATPRPRRSRPAAVRAELESLATGWLDLPAEASTSAGRAERSATVAVLTGAELQNLDCRKGKHGVLIFGRVSYHGECVNRDEVCYHCGLIVAEESWRRDAWFQRGRHIKHPRQKAE